MAGPLFYICGALAVMVNTGEAMNSEHLLVKSLLSAYEQFGVYTRPVFNPNETLRVDFGLSLIQIIDIEPNHIDPSKGSIKLKTWHVYSWKDDFLRWDPRDYDGVSTIRLPIQRIWRPDIVLYNSLDVSSSEDLDSLAVVMNDGSVVWIPQAIDHVLCQQEPQSLQWSCSLKFGSWAYDGFNLDLGFYGGSEEIDLSSYIASNGLEVVSHVGRRNTLYYPCCEEPYPDIVFTLELRPL